MIPGWITTAEAAKRLKSAIDGKPLKARRVLALITSGRLPAQRVGREWLIKVSDLSKVAHRKPGRPPARKPKKG